MRNYLNELETELRLLNYSQRTIECYRSLTGLFLREFNQEPETITEAQIKAYLKTSSSIALLKQRIGALKLFYSKVLHQPLKFRYIQYPRKEEHLPELLSIEEIRRIFVECRNMKHRAILMLIYSTGMREGEVINLRIADIDSGLMQIHIRQAKGKKDRLVKLSQKTLEALRNYYKSERPKEYLFNGQFSNQYSATSIRNMLKYYARKAGIKKRVYPHLLRHCSATHLYEAGTDMSVIQRMLGHRQQKTTMRYAHMSTRALAAMQTPDLFL